MDATGREEPTVKIADVLGHVRQKGVMLWSENGELHYRAPRGSLTQDEVERLRTHKRRIVDFLERSHMTLVEPRLEPRRERQPVPLTYSQLSHWNRFQLGKQHHVRQVASATRLRGRLNLDAMKSSVAEIVSHHEALRTRITVVDGVPQQEASGAAVSEMEVDDLTTVAENRRATEVQRQIEDFILEPVDVTSDPLFRVRLLQLTAEEHVLITAMEHIISDGFSRNILLRDLFTAYMQVSTDLPFSLPEVPIQFTDYAAWQRNMEGWWIRGHGPYWDKRLAGCQRLRFPDERSVAVERSSGWGAVPVHISSDLMTELREWCRIRHTTPVMAVFTAYAALVLRWCRASDVVIRYQSDGRTNPDVEHTIGYFAFALHLRVELFDDDNFVDLAERIRDEYCQAYEHTDYSYLEAQLPRPDIARSTEFNWVPAGPSTDLSGNDNTHGGMVRSPVPFVSPLIKSLEWDAEPAILLFDTGAEVVGRLYFPADRFLVSTMERFVRNFVLVIGTLLRQPQRRVQDVLTI